MDNYYSRGMAGFYDLIMDSGYYDYRKVVGVIKSILGQRRRVLEVGVGTGNIAIPLAKQGFDVDGIDPSQPMLNVARGKIAKEGLQIGLYLQDSSELNLPSKYDAVLSHGGVPVYIMGEEDLIFESYLPTLEENSDALQNVFEHLNEQGLFIVNIQKEHDKRRTLKLGDGLSYSSFVEYSGDFIRKTHIVKRDGEILMTQTFDIRRFDKRRTDDLLKQIGFRILGEDETGSLYVMEKVNEDAEEVKI